MENKIISLAKKLKALSERGVGGEKQNAEKMLLKFLDKHGISIEELEQNEKSFYQQKVGAKYTSFFGQIAVTISSEIKVYGHKSDRTIAIVECTQIEFVEIVAKFEFYKKEYEKDLKEHIRLFYEAFIQTNRLYPDTPSEESDFTPEEIQRMKKVLHLSEGMDPKKYHKQLNSK